MKNHGFTIVELLIVITILSALMLIAGISGRQWLDRYRVESQMKEMYTDLMNARARALQRNRMHFVTFPDGGTQYTIYEDTDPTPEEAFDPAKDTQVMQKILNPSYAVTSDAGEIDFDSRGLATGLTGTQTQATIRVKASYGAAIDCLTVSATRTMMGVYNGSTCIAQ